MIGPPTATQDAPADPSREVLTAGLGRREPVAGAALTGDTAAAALAQATPSLWTSRRPSGRGGSPKSPLDATWREWVSLPQTLPDDVVDRPVLGLLLREGRRLLRAGGTEFAGRTPSTTLDARAYVE